MTDLDTVLAGDGSNDDLRRVIWQNKGLLLQRASYGIPVNEGKSYGSRLVEKLSDISLFGYLSTQTKDDLYGMSTDDIKNWTMDSASGDDDMGLSFQLGFSWFLGIKNQHVIMMMLAETALLTLYATEKGSIDIKSTAQLMADCLGSNQTVNVSYAANKSVSVEDASVSFNIKTGLLSTFGLTSIGNIKDAYEQLQIIYENTFDSENILDDKLERLIGVFKSKYEIQDGDKLNEFFEFKKKDNKTSSERHKDVLAIILLKETSDAIKKGQDLLDLFSNDFQRYQTDNREILDTMLSAKKAQDNVFVFPPFIQEVEVESMKLKTLIDTLQELNKVILSDDYKIFEKRMNELESVSLPVNQVSMLSIDLAVIRDDAVKITEYTTQKESLMKQVLYTKIFEAKKSLIDKADDKIFFFIETWSRVFLALFGKKFELKFIDDLMTKVYMARKPRKSVSVGFEEGYKMLEQQPEYGMSSVVSSNKTTVLLYTYR